MTDPAGTTTAAPPVAGVAGTGPAAPATAPAAAPTTSTQPARAGDAFLPAAELTAKPGETGTEPKPDGTLPADVHPAVAAERARAKTYRDIASEAFVFDEHGQVVGIRQDFAEKVRDRLGASAPAAAAPGGDTEAALDAQVQTFADENGLLPGQVRGILRLIDYVATQRANEAVGPMMETSLDQMRGTLIASGDVPAEAAPFVNKWHAEAVKANPKAAMTAQGRETILRQALGEYALSLIRRRRSAAPANPAANTPTLLRPTPGGAATGPTTEERVLRRSMGLSEDYTANTPREGV